MKQEELKDHFEVARFGITVEQFIASPVGHHIISRAEMERERAINEFKSTDPSDVEKVRMLQNSINIPDKIVSWLSEAIENGRSAEESIHNIEAEQEGL